MQTFLALHKRFEAVAAAHPDRLAVSVPAPPGKPHRKARSLSYRELNERADALASRLLTLGAGPESLVGLCVERDESIVVGILGILKAGAAYVPIDPDAPKARIEFTLRDCGASLVVTSAELQDRLGGVRTVLVADAASENKRASFTSQAVGSASAAYVIYTSGSTGTPKGVVVEHGNATRLFDSTREWFHFGPDDVWTVFHSFAFDFSVWELWGALLYGGRCIIVPQELTRSPAAFLRLLESEGVTMLSQTPSAFRELVAADAKNAEPSRLLLRSIVFGGEALDVGMLRPWIQRYGDSKPELINMYGITETTVHVTYRRLTRSDCDGLGKSPIGSAIVDLSIHLLDPNQRPVREGEVGEIYVGGAGVARGYLNRPELNKERFSVVAALPDAGRLYRSGDLALRNAAGDLEYRGRIDAQVKVRGFRVELGEIEACLARCSGVQASVVVPHDFGEGDVRFLAYVVRDLPSADASSESALSAELARHAAEHLLSHMRPFQYIFVASVPLTSNGKVDRAALPLPQPVALGGGSDNVRTNELVTITELWEEVLNVRGVSPSDDFFDLGGTSLGLLRLLRNVSAKFGVDLDVQIVLDGPTIETFTRAVKEHQVQKVATT